ncbi:MAG: 5'-3' exonuclease, partial [Acidobacteriota bacterium]
MRSLFGLLVVAFVFIVGGFYSYRRMQQVPLIAPAVPPKPYENPKDYTEAKQAAQAVKIVGPLADYMANQEGSTPAAKDVETVTWIPTASDHVGGSVVGSTVPILRKSFTVRSAVQVAFQVPAHAASPQLRGTFQSSAAAGADAPIEVLVLSDDEYFVFVNRPRGRRDLYRGRRPRRKYQYPPSSDHQSARPVSPDLPQQLSRRRQEVRESGLPPGVLARVPAAKLERLSPRSKASIARARASSAAERDVASNVSTATPACVEDSTSAPGRIFLIDTMSFIFRAYHAMARQRPMSSKTGLPTAAIYVFVNMLRKLRDDFSPQYLAAVFDVAGRTFRDEQADSVTSIRKFDIKTQTFTEIEYKGYKANRKEMPEDLAQQVPYIRRALEAYRIPMIGVTRFEADDVIGTLARKAADTGHPVYIVSSDKDMMQLVNDKVHILNPPKDNLICDAAKVEEILGVPPERVIDVMALRGDSI